MEKLKENFGLVATFLGFVVDSATILALIYSNATIEIPFFDAPIDTLMKLLIWVLALLSYLGFLRDYWRKAKDRRIDDPLSQSFTRFLFSDLPKLKNPYALIGYAVLGVLLIQIMISIPNSDAIGQMACLFTSVSFFALIVGYPMFLHFQKQDEVRNDLEWEIINQEDNFEKWTHRISKELSKYGFATDLDLARLYSESDGLCYKALVRYLDTFEYDEDLALITEQIYKPGTTDFSKSKYLAILTYRNNLVEKEWLNNLDRFF